MKMTRVEEQREFEGRLRALEQRCDDALAGHIARIVALEACRAGLLDIIQLQDRFYTLFIRALSEDNAAAAERVVAVVPHFNAVLNDKLRRALRADVGEEGNT